MFVDWCDVPLARVTIDMLPDDVLLEIFYFYVDKARIEAWHTLVHVCRNWRNVVFGSPRRLGLQLECTASTPVRETLNIWPLFPIVVWNHGLARRGASVNNIIAALEHNDRICELQLFDIPLERVLAAMQQPFPALTRLELHARGSAQMIVPASFLGGSAPRLQRLFLNCLSFLGLPRLLLSATHLVHLILWNIPHSGYISPEEMRTALSVLTRLETFLIKFESSQSRPDSKTRRPPPQTRTVLPVLTWLRFKGVCEYLEDLLAWIDAPLLQELIITFFHQLIFDTPQLAQFISRTPNLKALDEARVVFRGDQVLAWVSDSLPKTFDGMIKLEILCGQFGWQLTSLAQICRPSFPHTLVPAVKHLYIHEGRYLRPFWQGDGTESSQWLELLHAFTAVKVLYVPQEFVPRIVSPLVGERVTEVLPALQTLCLEGTTPSGSFVREIIARFITARQDAGRPIAVSRRERK
jgi:hypothetical protein